MSQIQKQNRHAKKKDLSEVYYAAVGEANLTTSAMITILCNMLIDCGVLTRAEINELMRQERIDEFKDKIRTIIRNEEMENEK